MITPALQDDAFLADVKSAAGDPDALHVWWLGQSGFLVQHRGRHLLFDPYLSDSLTIKYAGTPKPHVRMSEHVIAPGRLDFIDVVTSTHNHTDHLDPDTLRPLLKANPRLRMVAPEANLAMVRERLGVDLTFDRLYGMNDPSAQQVGGFKFLGVPAAHEQRERDEFGNDRYMGFSVRSGDLFLYHSGDGVVYDGMAERVRRYPCDLAILPINGKVGNMNGADAARLAHEIGAKLVVPCHYEMFEFNTASPYELFVPECERLGQPYKVLRAGERLTLTK